MKIFNVGPDELDGLDSLDKTRYYWLVYYYELGDYDGGGLAVALRKDWTLVQLNLGHWSFSGPEINRIDNEKPIRFRDFLAKPESIFDDDYTPVRSKVLSLLG